MPMRTTVREILPSTEISGSEEVISSVYKTQQVDNIAVHVQWTGDLEGILTIQVSNDGDDWLDLPIRGVKHPSGSADSHGFSLALIAFTYLRLSYENTSGDGTLTAKLSAKGGI